MTLLRKVIPALWLAMALLFSLDPTSQGITGICGACPNTAEETAPMPCTSNGAYVQGITNAWRREGKDASTVLPFKPCADKLHAIRSIVPVNFERASDAFCLGQRWQFILRTAAPPRAPTSSLSS